MPYPVAPTVPGFEGPRPLPPSYGPQQPMPPSTPLPPIPVTQYVAPPQNQPVTPQNASGGLPVPIYTGSNTAPWASPTGQGYFGSGGGRLPSLAGMFNSMRQGISNNRFAQGLLGSLAGGMVAGPAGALVGGLYGSSFFGQNPSDGPTVSDSSESGGPSFSQNWRPQMYNYGLEAAPYIPRAPYVRRDDQNYYISPADASPGALNEYNARIRDYRNALRQEGHTESEIDEIMTSYQPGDENMPRRRSGLGTYRSGRNFVTGEIAPGSLGIYEGSRMDESRAPQTAAQNQMR